MEDEEKKGEDGKEGKSNAEEEKQRTPKEAIQRKKGEKGGNNKRV